MKFIGKITTSIVILALIVCAAVNTAIHIKSGEAKNLISNNNTQVEQPAEIGRASCRERV